MSVWSKVAGTARTPPTKHFSLRKHTQSCFSECTIDIEEFATNRYSFEISVCLDGEPAFKELKRWFDDIPGSVVATFEIEMVK